MSVPGETPGHLCLGIINGHADRTILDYGIFPVKNNTGGKIMNIPIDYVSLSEAARLLDCTQKTLFRLRKLGLVQSHYIYGPGPGKPVFFLKKEILEFFDRRVSVGQI